MSKRKTTKPAVDFSRSGVARYIQLATLYRRRIETGEWAVGQQIPTIDRLMAEGGVARETVRQALSLLESESWIERFRAKGTFVRERPSIRNAFDIVADFSGLFWARAGIKIEILSVRYDMELAGEPHPIGAVLPQYTLQQKRHWHSGAPFLITDNFYDPGVFEKVPQGDWETKGVLDILMNAPDIDIADARQTLTISSADIEAAAQLDMPLNGPVARVRRTAVDGDNNIIFYGDGLYRGDYVRLDIELK